MHAKLALVLVLIAYHLYCGRLLADFKHDRNRHGHVFYRWFNEFPVLILIAVGIAMTILMTRTRFGRYVFAIGGNPEAAALAGINTK